MVAPGAVCPDAAGTERSVAMKARQFIVRILLPGLALWAILWACNTPSIPMPPPGPEIVSFIQEDDTHWRFEIEANQYIQPGAEVTVKNLDKNIWVGGLAGADGSFLSEPFAGDLGDVVQLTFVKNGEGGTTCFVLQAGQNPPEDPLCGN
jgi:hypothetical protein